MTFILLRDADGDQSKDWQQATALVERIVASVLLPTDDLQREDRLKQLDALQEEIRAATGTLHQADKEKLMHGLFELQSAVLTGDNTESIQPRMKALPAIPRFRRRKWKCWKN